MEYERMSRFSVSKIHLHFQRGNNATTMAEKGRILEDLICYIFEKVSGIEVTARNELNAFDTEEIDAAFWNEKNHNGLYFLPHIFIVECKNWSQPVGSGEVSYFLQKLQSRGLDYGILVAVNGVTGSGEDIDRAHFEIAMALSRGIHLIVITRNEIESLVTTSDLVKLLKEKLCELAVSGTVFLRG
jgi:hypothetical protein